MAKRVLICDDSPYILEAVAYVVRSEGYEAVEVETGAAAVEQARAVKPSLLFLDLMLPDISGYDVCQTLKKDVDTASIHIILLTARGQQSDKERGKKVGANEYLTKPFSPRYLKTRLHEILD